MQVQKIIEVRGSIQEYIAQPHSALTEEHRRCPICAGGHRLWRHGQYERTAILPRGVSEVISTILLNFIAIQAVALAVQGPLQEIAAAYPQSDALPAAALLPCPRCTETPPPE
jgi:hypothetical protein